MRKVRAVTRPWGVEVVTPYGTVQVLRTGVRIMKRYENGEFRMVMLDRFPEGIRFLSQGVELARTNW